MLLFALHAFFIEDYLRMWIHNTLCLDVASSLSTGFHVEVQGESYRAIRGWAAYYVSWLLGSVAIYQQIVVRHQRVLKHDWLWVFSLRF